MVQFSYPIDTDHNIYPNIIVYQILKDGIHDGWRILSNENYVMYDKNSNDTEPEENDEGNIIEHPVIYYFTSVDFPPLYNWNNFAYVSIPRDIINEKYIL